MSEHQTYTADDVAEEIRLADDEAADALAERLEPVVEETPEVAPENAQVENGEPMAAPVDEEEAK